jgi:hypothetical protein
VKKSRILLFVLILFVSTSFIFAGYYYEQQNVNSGPQGEKTSISKTWITNGKIRIDNGKTITIIDTAKNHIMNINLNQKTYSEMTIDQLREMVSMGMKMMKQMMKSQNNGIEITLTGEKKVINEYPCYKVFIDMFGIKTVSWYSEKINIPKEVYSEITKLRMDKNDFDALVNNPEFKKIKGFPVETITTMNFMGMNVKTTTKLLKFSEMKIPSSIFNYNLSGFTKTEPKMGLGGR